MIFFYLLVSTFLGCSGFSTICLHLLLYQYCFWSVDISSRVISFKKRLLSVLFQGLCLFSATISAPPISLPILFSTDRFVANLVLFDSSVI